MNSEAMPRFGQNGTMPSRRERAADMPTAADRAFHALSSRARVEVLRFLISNSDQARPEIAEATGLSAPTVRIALEDLERLGYLTASAAPGERHGRRVTYSASASKLAEDHQALAAYIFG